MKTAKVKGQKLGTVIKKIERTFECGATGPLFPFKILSTQAEQGVAVRTCLFDREASLLTITSTCSSIYLKKFSMRTKRPLFRFRFV